MEDKQAKQNSIKQNVVKRVVSLLLVMAASGGAGYFLAESDIPSWVVYAVAGTIIAASLGVILFKRFKK